MERNKEKERESERRRETEGGKSLVAVVTGWPCMLFKSHSLNIKFNCSVDSNWQRVTVPRIFSGTGTSTFFRDHFFPVPVPVPSKKEQNSRDRDVPF